MYVITRTTDKKHTGRVFEALPELNSHVELSPTFYFIAAHITQVDVNDFAVGDSGYLTHWKWIPNDP